MKNKSIFLYILLLICVSDTLIYIGNAGFGDVFFTPLSLFCKYVVLVFLIYVARKSRLNAGIPNSIVILYKLLLFWNILTILHGALVAKTYWDWKFLLLSSSLFLLIPLVFFIGKNILAVRQVLYFFLKYIFTYGFLLLPLSLATNEELYARLMIPISFFIVMIPYLKTNHKILIIIVAIVSLLSILDFRANLIKIFLSFSFLITYYFRSIFKSIFYKWTQALLFSLPVILLLLAVFGGFNIFKAFSESATYEVSTKLNDSSNLAADTRTFIYIEVFQTLNTTDSWLFGQGASGKYKSQFFTDLITGDQRYGSEVGVLNTILYSGITGLLIYFLVLIYSSYYAIYKSNNMLCKMLGLIIASRWLLFFLEEFTQFDINFYFLWIIIGLVSSTKFRALSDKELKQFFNFKLKVNPNRVNKVVISNTNVN